MNKSIVVYGPAEALAKYGRRIAKHFGLSRVVMYNGTGSIEANGGLFLCEQQPQGMPASIVKTFAEVAKQINDAIPRTPWFPPSTRPVHHGAYETTDTEYMLSQDDQGYQVWDGNRWGGFGISPDDAVYGFSEAFQSSYQHNYWRGLSEEPIIVPGAA